MNEKIKDVDSGLRGLTIKASLVILMITLLIALSCCIAVATIIHGDTKIYSALAIAGIVFNFFIVVLMGFLSMELIQNIIIKLYIRTVN